MVFMKILHVKKKKKIKKCSKLNFFFLHKDLKILTVYKFRMNGGLVVQ